jgi:hypothetical protein
MQLKIFMALILVSLFNASLVFAEAFQAGPVFFDKVGEVGVVVALPSGTTPKASDFRLVADGKTIAVGSDEKPFRFTDRGLALVLCVDVSPSMKGTLSSEQSKRALTAFLESIKAGSENHVAITFFADEVKMVSLENLREGLSGYLKVQDRKTRLYDTLSNSMKILQSPQLPKQRRVMVITDGYDVGSRETLGNVITTSTFLGIPIDAVGIGENVNNAVLGQLATSTGGRFVRIKPAGSLKTAIVGIYNDHEKGGKLLVTFPYKRDASGRMTQNAAIELQQTGNKVMIANVAGQVPSLDPGVKGKSILWILIGLLLLLLMAIGYFLFARQEKPGNSGRDDKSGERSLPQLKDTDVEAIPGQQSTTRVGGYYFPVPEQGKAVAELIGIDGPVAGKYYAVNKELYSIGRAEGNDLCIADDDFVSRNHAYLRYEKGSLFVFDKGSTGGTFVNNNRITDTGVALDLGDRIKFGNSTVEVKEAAR